MRSAEVMPENCLLCFNKFIHPTPSFWATTVLQNSWTLKAEVEGQQLFIRVDAPQRRWTCWTSHLEWEKQFPFGLSQWGEETHAHSLTWRALCLFWLRHTTAAPPGAHHPWKSSRPHMHHGIIWKPLCHDNQKILVRMKGNKAPITVHRITVIHPIFFPDSLHSYHSGAGRLQKYMCK